MPVPESGDSFCEAKPTISVVSPQDTNDYTRYFLDNPRKTHRIEVFVLKDYLPQKLKLEFRPRTAADIH
jgi:hypothetical protein